METLKKQGFIRQSGSLLCLTQQGQSVLEQYQKEYDIFLLFFHHSLGFSLLESKRLTFSCTVEGAQVQNLLAMTPHFWRISKEGAQRLAETKRLEDRASIILNVYQKEVSYGAGNRI